MRPNPIFGVIAHRGYSSLSPENTCASFDLALTVVPAFELDVQLTKDGVCIVLHDEKLGRTNDGDGHVQDASWTTLSQLDAGMWFGPSFVGCRIPTLNEVLDRYRNQAHIHLELKSQQPGLAQAVKAELLNTGWLSDLQRQSERIDCSDTSCNPLLCVPGLTITSFHLDQLTKSIEVLPGITHGWLVQELTEPILKMATAAGVTQLCPRVDACSTEAVDRALASGFVSIRGWGVKTMDLLHHAVACGMHGATVNWPKEAKDALKLL